MSMILIEVHYLSETVCKYGFNSIKDLMNVAGLGSPAPAPSLFKDEDDTIYYRFRITDVQKYVYFSIKYESLT